MEIGIDSFVADISGAATASEREPVLRMREILEQIEAADQAGIDIFGIGEHHRVEFLDSAPAMILAAAAARTKQIRLTSAVTVLSAADPVRVFQEFATLDLLSEGRAEMIVGRGSFSEAFPLFGFEFADYDALFAEKLELLLQIRAQENITWAGRFRAPLIEQSIYPRPVQPVLPIWLGVGGTPASFARAGTLGLPLMIAIIGGEPRRFAPLVDMYRKAAAAAGHSPETLSVGVHALGYVAETTEQAVADFFPGYAREFTKIGRERGWPPITRAGFEAMRSPHGALLVGSPDEIVHKIRLHSEALGGINRITFQSSAAGVSHDNTLRSIALIGSAVLPQLGNTTVQK